MNVEFFINRTLYKDASKNRYYSKYRLSIVTVDYHNHLLLMFIYPELAQV